MTVRFNGGASKLERSSTACNQPLLLPSREQFYRGIFKRILDTVLVLAVLPFVLPAMAIFAILIACDGHSPFYTQMRVGKGGRIFRLWKLRSMVHDADARLAVHLAANPEDRKEWDAFQKLTRDPRITPLGHILRKSSMDELPQLWNVLKGDMSLVGPRPMMPEQLPLYPGKAYFALRPGLTGPWQVSDRNSSTFAQRAEFDALYDGTLSLAADIKLMFATVGVVLRCTGH